jgi:hypothetical protein
MDIAELLRSQPLPAGVLLRGMPASEGQDGHLVRQVIALANADLAGTRCLLFGAEQGAGGVPSVIGLEQTDCRQLQAQLELCRDAIEPALELELVSGDSGGKRLMALVVAACPDPPYVAGDDAPAPLRAGECWLFDAQGMRPATRADLDDMYATRRRRQQLVLVGIGDDPQCELLDVQVPDASWPPSRAAALKLRSAITAKKTAAAIMGHDDTEMERLAHARIYGADAPFRHNGLDTLVRALRSVADDYREADLYFRFEERALHVNFRVMNAGTQALSGAAIEITIPAVPGLAVATSLHPPPGEAVRAGASYPEVRRSADCFRARSSLGELAPGRALSAFATPLRIAVDRSLIGQKIAMRYSLVAADLKSPCRGRLRLKLGG